MKGAAKKKKNTTKAGGKRFEVDHGGITVFDGIAVFDITDVAFHASDEEPGNCWGDSVRWIRSPFTRAQLTANPLLMRYIPNRKDGGWSMIDDHLQAPKL